MPIIIESYSEFAERHGGDPLEVGGRILFRDGASTDSMDMMRHEPATGIPLLQAKQAYLIALIKIAEERRNRVQNDWAAQEVNRAGGTGAGRPNTWREELAAGLRLIDGLKQEAVALEVEIRKAGYVNPTAVFQQQQYDKQREARDRIQEIRSA